MAPVSHLRPGTQDQQRSQISARLTSLVQAADAAECSSQFDPRVGLRPRAAQTASQTITDESRCQCPPASLRAFRFRKGCHHSTSRLRSAGSSAQPGPRAAHAPGFGERTRDAPRSCRGVASGASCAAPLVTTLAGYYGQSPRAASRLTQNGRLGAARPTRLPSHGVHPTFA